MKCTIKAKCPKDIFLKYALHSVECKYRKGYTYGWYDFKMDAEMDKYSLNQAKIKNEIIRGWDIEGFVTFKFK